MEIEGHRKQLWKLRVTERLLSSLLKRPPCQVLSMKGKLISIGRRTLQILELLNEGYLMEYLDLVSGLLTISSTILS